MSNAVKPFADAGFRTHHGLLLLIVPAVVAEMVRQAVAKEIDRTEAAGPRFVEALGWDGYVAEFAERLRPGMRKAVPLGKWGSLGWRRGELLS
jgi:hypothetical protein